METKWLEDLVCLARTGSFSRAAEQRNVTQPAFSRRIKALEGWLGVDLVDRANYPVTLTSEGEAFREVAENILHQLDSSREKFRNKWRCTNIDITIASLDSLSTSFYPSWLKQLARNGEVPSTQLLQNSLRECVEYLERDDCDFVLCYTHGWAQNPLENNETASILLAQEKLVPICHNSKNGPVFKSVEGTPENPLPLLAYSPDCFLGQVMQVTLDRLNKQHAMRIVYENSTATSLKVMVEHGYGIAWIPERLVCRELKNRELSVIQEFNWVPPLDIRLYRSAKTGRPAMENFWTRIAEDNALKSEQTPRHHLNGKKTPTDSRSTAMQ